MVHPLFGLFAEPASTVIVSAEPSQIGAIEELADTTDFSRLASEQPEGIG